MFPETEENILFCARYGGDTEIIYILNSEFSESKNYSFISPRSQSFITNTAGDLSKLRFGTCQARVKYHCSFNKAFLYSNPCKVCSHQLYALRPLWNKKLNWLNLDLKETYQNYLICYFFLPIFFVLKCGQHSFIDYRFFMLTLCGKVEYFICV